MFSCLWRKWAHSRARFGAFTVLRISEFPSSFRVARRSVRLLLMLLFASWTVAASSTPTPESCIPIRWTGGPLEVAWRTRAKTLPADSALRTTLARWYEPSTLSLLEDSPVNCLLVTWSAPGDEAIEVEQQRIVKAYAESAHKRGLTVLGIVYGPGDAPVIAASAAGAGLDGLVLEGEYTPQFSAALRTAAGSMPVIEIAIDTALSRWNSAPIIAVAGVAPSGHNLSEMGIRGAPSSEPWIESNIWLVRSLTFKPARAVWVSSELENASAIDYARAVADAAAAGGHWIISLDDTLRAKLRTGDAAAMESWRRLSSYLRFAETHSEWRGVATYGKVGFVLDPARANQDGSDEYLKLAARRQVPYRLVARSELNSGTAAAFAALVTTALDPPSGAERRLLQNFAENGGLVIAGPSWGGAAKTEPFTELPAGKGRVLVYQDPEPDAVARDLKELLSDDELGVVPFNVPSVIASASGGQAGQPLLVQLVNYFDHPVEAITLRVVGKFRSARMETPEAAGLDLPLREADGKTEVTIPKLLLWGALSIE